MVCLTATIQSGYADDIKAFFHELKKITELETIKAVIRLPKGVEITFQTEKDLRNFIANAPEDWNVKSEVSREILITTSPSYGDGHCLIADSTLWTFLTKYGDVKKGRRLYFKDFPNIENGVRQFVIVPKEDAKIPGMVNFGRTGFRLAYRGQQKTCHRCQSTSHEVKQCTVKICFRCQQIGHEKADCNSKLVCTICKEEGHGYARCPTSWANKVRLDKSWSKATIIEQQPESLDIGTDNAEEHTEEEIKMESTPTPVEERSQNDSSRQLVIDLERSQVTLSEIENSDSSELTTDSEDIDKQPGTDPRQTFRKSAVTERTKKFKTSNRDKGNKSKKKRKF